MSNSFSYLIPVPQAAIDVQFEIYHDTHDFYDEVHLRQAHLDYCRWYAQVADQHRQELRQMQGEVNPLGWFYRR